MHKPLSQQLIEQIAHEWHSVRKNGCPSGVWICEYPPLALDADAISHRAQPVAVWFLDQDGLRQESLDVWHSHVANAERSHPEVSDMRFPVGFAAFALYEGESTCYSETQWGPRWGRGWCWTVKDGRLHGRDNLWVS